MKKSRREDGFVAKRLKNGLKTPEKSKKCEYDFF